MIPKDDLFPHFDWFIVSRPDWDSAFKNGRRSAPLDGMMFAASAQYIYFEPSTLAQASLARSILAKCDSPFPGLSEVSRVLRPIMRGLKNYALCADNKVWWLKYAKPEEFFISKDVEWMLMICGVRGWRQLKFTESEMIKALALLPLLRFGNSSDLEITKYLVAEPAASDFLRCLFDESLVRERVPRRSIRNQPGKGLPSHVQYWGHASVSVRHEGKTIVFDPCVLSSGKAQTESPNVFSAGLPDAIFITHHHWDHMHYQTLAWYPRSTRIYVPMAKARRTFMNPPMNQYLAWLGFEDVVELDDWQSVAIGNIRVLAVPFYGESFGLNSHFDAYAYVVEVAQNYRFMGTVDACFDEEGSMNEVLRDARLPRDIDALLVGCTGKTHASPIFAAGVRHFSNELTNHRHLLRYHANCDDVLGWATNLEPTRIFPYANFSGLGSTESGEWRSEFLKVISKSSRARFIEKSGLIYGG